MSASINKTAIGAFVVGAIALLVAGVLVLGGGKFFTQQHTYVTYFGGSVKGLSVGSPVTFRGVKVGTVTDISIIADPAVRGLRIPVIFDLEPGKFKGTQMQFQRDAKFVEKAIKELGLRTQLQSLSFVTGQLSLALDFFPGTKPEFVGLTKEYPEIPSVPTPFEQLQKSIENLPLREIVQNLNATLAEVEKLAKSINPQRTLDTTEAALRDVQTLVRHVDAKVDPLIRSLTTTMVSADSTLQESKELVVAAKGEMKDLVASTKAALDSAQAALAQSEQTLQAYSEDSRLAIELNKTLRDLAATSRSLRRLTDYLERHPESVVRGKAGKGE